MLGNIAKSSIALTIFAAIGSTILPVQAALLVSSGGDNTIKQYDETTGAYIRDFVTSGSGGLSNPQGLTVGADNNLYVSSLATSSIKKYNGTTGEYLGDFVTSSSGLLNPQGLTSGTDNSLFVVSSNIPGSSIPGDPSGRRSGVLQYDLTTGVLSNTTVVTGVSSSTLSGPQPVDVALGGPNNSLFVSQGRARFNSGSIGEYNPTSGQAIFRNYTVTDPSVSSINPQGLAITDNFLYYTDGASIGRFDLVNNIIDPRFVDVSSGGLSGAVDVSIGQNGNLLVSDFNTDSIKQYDSNTGDYLGDFIASSSGGLDRPTYLTTANVPVPEPSSVLGIAALGGLFVGGALQRKANRRKQLNSL